MIPSRHEVEMDECHAQLIGALVKCMKPASILEIGIGSGAVTDELIRAVEFNGRGQITVVDNWLDWNGHKPDAVSQYTVKARVITDDEHRFLHTMRNSRLFFDLIVLDADHGREHESVHVALECLAPGGALAMHDATNQQYPKMREAIERIACDGWSHVVMSRSSRSDERCERGLLVVFKKAV